MIRRILLSLLILIAATSAAQAAEQNFSERKTSLAEVSGVRVGYGSGTIRIVVDLSKKVEFVESYAENPSRMIIDLKDSWLSPTVKREIELKSLAAKKIRVAQFNETTVRIVIETMAETKIFHLDGGTKGHRLVIDVGNADFKPNPEANKPKPNADALKQQQERDLKENQERELKAQQERELKEQQERDLKENQERELKAQQERELKEQQERDLKAQQERDLKAQQERDLKAQQERERELARRERELAQRERELKEREEKELKKKQEQELKEQQERELKERQERERELARRERELAQRERELKEREEKELKKQQERELKEREKKERELKKQQERELKEKRERDIKEQREREKQLKEKEKQERREKKDKDKKKDKAEDDDEKTAEVNEPFKGLENDLGEITALSGKKIVIDPGHGGNDAGAIGPTGVMEKTVTLNVARELRKLLEAEGAQVIMTREGDTTVSAKGAKASDIEELGARCEVANRVGADIFISIHADSFTRPEARGTTGYYYSKSTSGRGQKLADCIRRNLVEQLGTPSRGTQPCNFYVVKHTDMPATLIELGFISNKEEEKLLSSDEGVKKAAQGILDGIEDYFG
ncbi:MAG: N-acetylmuramoyl-L-alanine amidase [Selenomonadaceae bacterium]|nr:N-acetylmuramoyl-L-alanine amidase [Selenomonadaceae bacterium]